MSQIIDVEFIRYPRELDGKPAPPAFDAEAAVNDFVAMDRDKMVSYAIMKAFYEKEAHAFRFGNRK